MVGIKTGSTEDEENFYEAFNYFKIQICLDIFNWIHVWRLTELFHMFLDLPLPNLFTYYIFSLFHLMKIERYLCDYLLLNCREK